MTKVGYSVALRKTAINNSDPDGIQTHDLQNSFLS